MLKVLTTPLNPFRNWKPIYTDGLIYGGIAFCAFWSTHFSSDEAYKYVVPKDLYWMRGWSGAIAATLLALKLFRSTSYAEHIQNQKAISDGVVKTSVSKETTKKESPVIITSIDQLNHPIPGAIVRTAAEEQQILAAQTKSVNEQKEQK